MFHGSLTLSLIVIAIAAAGFWLEGRYRWARQVGASMIIILLGALLSNLGVVAAASPVYDFVSGPVTSLAIVWLLLAVDLRDLRQAGPRMLLAFLAAVLASAVGAILAAGATRGAFPEDGWRLAAVMTGTYAGGSVNFVAVGRGVGLSDSLFTAAAAADNVMTSVWMGATLLLPLWLWRFFPPAPPGLLDDGGGDDPLETASGSYSTLLRAEPFEVLALTALGLGTLQVSEAIAGWLPGVPAVIWLTTLALMLGQLPPVRALRGAFALGLLALNLFFAVIGIGSRIGEILRVGPEVLYFTALVVLTHGLLAYGLGRLLRLDVATVSVASQAAVGGPSTALALATARGWRHLALPGIVVGLLGYALGNYLGFAVGALVRAL